MRPILLTSLLLLPALLSCGGSEAPVAAVPYRKVVVKDPQQSAAFLAVEDLDGDGKKEIILSTLVEQTPPGPPTSASRGALRIFKSANPLTGPWTERAVIATTDVPGYPFINRPQVMDVDGDGIKDLVVHTGFLTTLGGSHFWLKGPEFTTRSYFATETTVGRTMFFWHESGQSDLDGDGKQDIVSTSVQTQFADNPLGTPNGKEALKVEWYRHLGGGSFEYHQIADGLGGVFLKMKDIDADGDDDIVLTQFFGPPAKPSVLWLEMTERPSAANSWQGVFVPHPIDSTIGFGYHMEFADINGDGRDDLVVGAHNNQDDTRLKDAEGNTILPGLYWFEWPSDPRRSMQWVKHTVSQSFRITLSYGSNPGSQGTPGIFSVGDMTGDGRPDIAVAGDGNAVLYLFVQNADGSFTEEHPDENEKMFGMAVIADLDGDGVNEIVAAKHNSADGGTSLPPGFLKIYLRNR